MIEASATGDVPESVIQYEMSAIPFAAATWHLMAQKLRWTWILAPLVALVAVGLHVAGVGAWIFWIGIGQLALVVVMTITVWASAVQRWRAKLRLADAQESTLSVNKLGLHSHSGLGEARIAWPMVRRIERRTAFWLIHFRASDDVAVVPAEALTDAFRAALEQHARAAGVELR